MLTIKIKHRKIKVFNLLLILVIFILFIYILISLILLLPFLNKKYDYTINGKNYKINSKVVYKKRLLKCIVKESISINSNDKGLYDFIKKDYLKDGYIYKNNNLILKYNVKKKCGSVLDDYKKIFEKTNFKLLGNEEENVNWKGEYEDKYVSLIINNKKSKNININSDLNLKKTGKYYKTYYIENNNIKNKLFRIINVIDNEKPLIELKGDKEIELNYSDNYKEEGYVATDNYDGDITKNVKIKNNVDTKKAGIYYITYTVKDSSSNSFSIKRKVIVNENKEKTDGKIEVKKQEHVVEEKDGITYVDGVLIVNKKYSVPKNYNPGVNKEAELALKSMQNDAKKLGYDLSLLSGFRSYERQNELYSNYVKKHGEEKASTFSAKPGHSEHQTGLAFDVGKLDYSFGNTPSGKWLEENCHKYGFILRYLKGKEDITGYVYEPWHVRYLGTDIATKVKESGLSLEEYLGVN